MTLNIALLTEETFMREANGIHTAVRQLEATIPGRPGVRLVQRGEAPADVVHAHTVGARYLWNALVRKAPLVVSAHVTPGTCLGGVRFDRLCYALTRPYLRLAYNLADVVIAVSPAVTAELKELGVRSRVVELCNSVDRGHFRPELELRRRSRDRLGLDDEAFVVLGVGQAQPRKGLQNFVNVARMLPDMRFVWVGGRPFGRSTAAYEEISRLMQHPPPNVTFTGVVPLEEMPGYYNAADAFFFPSFQECFGYAVVEAAATGLPVLLRNNPEYAAYFFNHYLQAGDDAGFAATLQRLQADRAFYRQWQAEAQKLADHYSLDKYLEHLVTIYRQAAAAGRRSRNLIRRREPEGRRKHA